MNHKRNFALLISIPSLLDGVLTLTGQDPAYWTDYSKYNEGNPLGALALGVHPLLYLAVALGWTAILFCITYFLSKKPSLAFGLFWFIIHTINFSLWIPYNLHLYFGLSGETFDSVGTLIADFSAAILCAGVLYLAIQRWVFIEKN